MDEATQRAAERAANKLLKTAGYDPGGKSLRKVMSKHRRAEQQATSKRQRQVGKATNR